jgi:hypothetical protein
MTNAHPPLLLAAGLPLPNSAELPKLPDGGATADDPPEPALTAGAGLAGGGGWDAAGTALAGGGGWDAAGAALVGAGAGTDETCETCET